MLIDNENDWFDHLRLGLLETTKFIYGDQVNIKYSKEYALEVALLLDTWSKNLVK